MQTLHLNEVTLHYRHTTGAGMPVVFLNSLGTDFRIWNTVVNVLGPDTPTLCLDKRGHGLSDDGPISMDLLVRDIAALMDHLQMPPALICGVSVGGMIAQGLAFARPDLVAGLVLCCTGAQIGDAEGWQARIDAVRNGGIAAMADAILERWFSPHSLQDNETDLAAYRNMLIRTSADGYVGVCSAIRDTNFFAAVGNMSMPTHCVAGGQDLATPAAVVAELADLISDASFEVIDNCGHLRCIEAPSRVSAAITKLRDRLA